MKGWYFGPVRRSGVIKRVQFDFAALPTNDSTTITDEEIAAKGRDSRIVTVPGLLPDGSPTTNSTASIHYSLISANSNFGIASNTNFFLDNRKYSPIQGEDSE